MRSNRNIYELAERSSEATRSRAGDVGAIMKLVDDVGLVHAINELLHILKVARPYQDSDHVLNIGG